MTRWGVWPARRDAPDTPEAVAERIRFRAAGEAAIRDREAKYPRLTADNALEAIEYQESRVRFHLSEGGR